MAECTIKCLIHLAHTKNVYDNCTQDNIAILATYLLYIQDTYKRNGRSKWALSRVLERKWWKDGVPSSHSRI